ncbi:MAG: succinate dehydrogenase assembly factor 2 [Hyphomicrobiales bacterium]|nr:succinate dehydrogenase assembly factor 2 [Hyphomicrobiales bacterium]
MSGQSLSSAALDARRRRALTRAWRRGTREMDLLLGRFADAELPSLAEPELDAFERLLDLPDPALAAILVEGAPAPAGVSDGLLERMRALGLARR